MSDTTAVIESPLKTAADAETFAEHKAIRGGEKVPATVEPPEKPKVEKQEPSEPPEKKPAGESAAASEAAKEDAQEPGKQEPEKPKRDRSAEGRISELTAARKRAEDEAADLRRKLAELQAPKPAAEPPKPAAPQTSSDDAPNVDDYDGSKGKTYEDYLIAKARYQFRQEQQATERERQQQAIQDTANRKVAQGREKYADFEPVVTAASGHITPYMKQFFMESDSGPDVLYELAKNPGELVRIAALPAARQFVELGKIESRISQPSETMPPRPEPTVLPVSKAPPPPRPVGGTEAPAPPSLADARDFSEHKRLRLAKR